MTVTELRAVKGRNLVYWYKRFVTTSCSIFRLKTLNSVYQNSRLNILQEILTWNKILKSTIKQRKLQKFSLLNIQVFLYIRLSRPANMYRCFGGNFCLNFQGRSIRKRWYESTILGVLRNSLQKGPFWNAEILKMEEACSPKRRQLLPIDRVSLYKDSIFLNIAIRPSNIASVWASNTPLYTYIYIYK